MRCQGCNHEWSGSYGESCPQCGLPAQNPFEASGKEAAPPTASPWQSPRAAADEPPIPSGPGIPWENEQSASSMFDTIKKVLLESQETFAGARKEVGIGPAFTYALMLGIAGGVVGNVWNLAFGGLMGSLAGAEGFAGSMMSGVGGFVMIPIWIVMSLFIGAGVLHLCLMMVGGANAGFEATFRVVSYAVGSAAPFQLVPMIGPLIGGIWAIVIEIMGLKEIHNTTTGKAAAAVLLPILACCCCIGAGAMAAAGSAASILNN